MKIYFVGSISGKKEYLENYLAIISVLEKFGHQVKTNTINPMIDFQANPSDEEKVKFYKKVLKDIGWADVVVGEVSFSSMGVGYEISTALEKGKPVLALFDGKHMPVFLGGVDSEKFEVIEYNLENLEKIVGESLEYLFTQQDVRFNFFVSPEIVNYLNWISRYRKIPRAVYLRGLIEKEMEKKKISHPEGDHSLSDN